MHLIKPSKVQVCVIFAIQIQLEMINNVYKL